MWKKTDEGATYWDGYEERRAPVRVVERRGPGWGAWFVLLMAVLFTGRRST